MNLFYLLPIDVILIFYLVIISDSRCKVTTILEMLVHFLTVFIQKRAYS